MIFESDSDYVDEAAFARLAAERFPELRTDFEEDAGLIHLQMGAVAHLANDCIRAGDFGRLARVYDFIAELAVHERQISRAVANAIALSFVEHLLLDQRQHGARARELLPPVLRAIRERVA